MVGGISALIGTAILGPRLGKYSKNKDGSIKVNAIPGHSITLGALGCFILWFGWYGFNGAAASDGLQLSQIFGTTTISAGVATCVTMIFTWIKNGKPDVSMTLNGSLAGLESAYGGFAISEVQPAAIPSVPAAAADMESAEETSAEGKLTKIEILCNESKFEDLKNAMNAIGVTGMTVTKVLGCGIQKGQDRYYRGVKIESMDLKPKVQVEIVVAKVPVRRVIETASRCFTPEISATARYLFTMLKTRLKPVPARKALTRCRETTSSDSLLTQFAALQKNTQAERSLILSGRSVLFVF